MALDKIAKTYYIRGTFRRGIEKMPASYRREVEYDRNRTSRVNPVDDEVVEFVNPAHVTVSGPHFVTGINKPQALDIGGDDYRHVLTPESF